MGWDTLPIISTEKAAFGSTSKRTPNKEYLAKIKYQKVITKKASSFKDIVSGKLISGVQYRIVTDQSFNAITVIQYLLEFYQIQELYIVVYRMNNKAFDYLSDLINSGIKISFIISDFFRENKRYERWAYELKSVADRNRRVSLAYTHSHAKVFLAKTTTGEHIVFEGSGNLSDNARIEQYIIENNKEVYDFHKEWIEEILHKVYN